MGVECLKEQYLKVDKECEDLRSKLRSELYSITSLWWNIERSQNCLELTESSGYNVEITPEILIDLQKELGCKLKVNFNRSGELRIEEVKKAN
jgi:hypothetical protein